MRSSLFLVLLFYLITSTSKFLSAQEAAIAGPSGGTKVKPVGLIYFGIKYKNKTMILEKKFKGTRIQIQQKTVKAIFSTLEKLI